MYYIIIIHRSGFGTYRKWFSRFIVVVRKSKNAVRRFCRALVNVPSILFIFITKVFTYVLREKLFDTIDCHDLMSKIDTTRSRSYHLYRTSQYGRKRVTTQLRLTIVLYHVQPVTGMQTPDGRGRTGCSVVQFTNIISLSEYLAVFSDFVVGRGKVRMAQGHY